MGSMNIQDSPENAVLDAAIAGGDMVLVKFQTKSCVVCRRLEPGLKAVTEPLSGKLRVLAVDAEENAALAERYAIQSVPTLILIKDGIEAARCNGFQSTSMLRDWVAPHVND